MRILITGCAGFIGFHLCFKLKKNKKYKVFGIDNLNTYYDLKLKKDRLKILSHSKNFKFYKLDICNLKKIQDNFKLNKYDVVINLAAQAGVRHSISNSGEYFKSNLKGFYNVLEVSRLNRIKHFIFASTSSVYGDTKKFPISESQDTSLPLSFYAATKKSNEVLAYSFSNIHNLACTGLRFFTVYGEYGRPDMALFKFTKSIIECNKLYLYNNGNHIRDFTHVSDVVKAIYLLINKPSKESIPYNIFNIGNGKPHKLKFFLKLIEKELGKKAEIIKLPLQAGDIYKTHANIKALSNYTNFKPKIEIDNGIKKFLKWYTSYFK